MPHAPIWTDAPFDPTRPPTLRLVRTPHDRPIEILPTCTRPVGTFTHYHQRRTIPCPALPDCELCRQGIPYRWHGYLSGMLLPHREHIIWQYTAPLAPQITDYLNQYQTLRGAIITAKRIAPYPNARIAIYIRPAGPNAPNLYPEPDIRALLCNIWQVPITPPTNPRLTEAHAQRLNPTPDATDPRYSAKTNGRHKTP